MSIAENIRIVRDKIGEAALKTGRDTKEIVLVAATKMNDAERVRLAIEAGVDAVGENRVQELLEKNEQGAYHGAPLHFIGHLQKNKVRQIVGLCDLIESVDSVELMELISRRALSMGIKQDILIEVNIGREASKSGVMPEELERILENASLNQGIFVSGLMAIPPFNVKNNENYCFFHAMYQLFVDIRGKKYDNVSMNFLSMGMSDTFTDAICAGANMVRVGSAIFGARHY
jgi:pyridoxal phosphate enzyme (YggS family)